MKPGALASDIAAAHDKALRARWLRQSCGSIAMARATTWSRGPSSAGTMALAGDMNLAVHPGHETPEIFAVICDNYLIGPDGPGACLHHTEKKIFELG